MIYLYGINSITQYLIYKLNVESDKIEILVDNEFYNTDNFNGYKIKKINDINFKSNDSVYVCLGYKNLKKRYEMCQFFLSKNILKSYISPSSFIHNSTKIDKGNIVMNNVFIDFDVNIGIGNIFWNNSIISHNAVIKNSNFFATGSVIGGFTSVNNFCFFGFNSSVKQKITVPNDTKLGANKFMDI